MSLKPSLTRLASSITKKPLASNSAFSQSPQNSPDLLSPIILYRRLLRVHRKVLPVEMRLMGDEYVKAEFRRTRTATNPLHLVGFLSEWQKYLEFHEKQAVLVKGKSSIHASSEISDAVDHLAQEEWKEGQKLPDEILESLSADQLGQLHELLLATREVWKSTEELPDGAHVIGRENVEEAEDAGIKGLGGKGEGGK